MTTLPGSVSVTSPEPAAQARRLPLDLPGTWLPLALIVVVAAVLRLANLDDLGQANAYYTAAVKSMLESWHNFFYAAAEPGGSVSVDKPPLGLWLQALSAYVLGVSGFAVVLPQIVAGLGSVVLLFHLVRRSFGRIAALLAAAGLALTPVAIAVERNNTPDATLIFTLLLATWAFFKATETGRLRPLLLGALLLGVGFNIKMLQAFLPLPALYGLYLFGAQASWRRKLSQLGLATLVLVLVSLSWALAVDLTPADQRPYVGGSGDNSVFDLIFGYNGLQRLQGNPRPGGAAGAPGLPPGAPGSGLGPGDQPPDGPGGPGGAFETGTPGPLRMFQAGLAAQVSWLLPLGLLVVVALALSVLRRWGQLELRRGLLLWGGWLVTCVVFFSIAGFFHQYYLAMLGAPLAALVGIGLASLWRLRADRPRSAALLLLGLAAVTLAFQLYAVALYQPLAWWNALPLLAALAGLAALPLSWRRGSVGLARAGYGAVTLALLVVPAVWSGLTTAHAEVGSPLAQAYGSTRGILPGAPGAGLGLPPGGAGALARPREEVSPLLLRFLETNTQDTRYMLVVPSSMVGAPYVLATGRPVLYAGGFNGSDPVLDAAGLGRLVDEGSVRFVLWGGRPGPGGRPGGQGSGIASYLQSSCVIVTDVDPGPGESPPALAAPGAPGGPGFGAALALYRCGL